jgi:hypothetical protein
MHSLCRNTKVHVRAVARIVPSTCTKRIEFGQRLYIHDGKVKSTSLAKNVGEHSKLRIWARVSPPVGGLRTGFS